MAERTYEEQLAGISTHRWQKTLERAEVIERYLKIPRPSTSEADAHAEELGISRRFFYKLVRIFEERRAGPAPQIKPIYSSGRLREPFKKVITAVIDDLGVEAKLSDIIKETHLRSQRLQIPAPSSNAIRIRFNAARLANPARQDLSDIVIDHCGLALPIQDRQGTVRDAVITSVIHPGTGLIFGHHVDITVPEPPAVAMAILDALKPVGLLKRRPNPKIEIAYERDDNSRWVGLADAFAHANITGKASKMTPRSAGRVLMRIIGTRLGRIYLAPRSTFTRQAPARMTDDPVPIEQARATIRQIVEQRNGTLTNELVLQEILGARRTTNLRIALQSLV